MHVLSYENEFYLQNSFEYERLSTKPRFEKEAQDKKMAYCNNVVIQNEKRIKENSKQELIRHANYTVKFK